MDNHRIWFDVSSHFQNMLLYLEERMLFQCGQLRQLIHFYPTSLIQIPTWLKYISGLSFPVKTAPCQWMASQTGFHDLSGKRTFFSVSVRGWGKKFSQLPDKERLYLKSGWKHKCWLSEWKNLIKFPKEQDTSDINDWQHEAGKYSI